MADLMTPDAFRLWRRERLSQIEAAKLLGISQTTISHYENGNWPIPQNICDKVKELTIERNPTIADLTKWINQRHLSPVDAAAVIGVSVATLERLEHARDKTALLSPLMARRLREADPASYVPVPKIDYLYGHELSPDDQAMAKFLCPNRYTLRDNTPDRVLKWQHQRKILPEFADDEEWLLQSIFRVHPDGSLNRKQKEIICIPTWPTKPDRCFDRPVIVLHCLDGRPKKKARGDGRFAECFHMAELKVKAEWKTMGLSPPKRTEKPASYIDGILADIFTPEQLAQRRIERKRQSAELTEIHMAHLKEADRIRFGVTLPSTLEADLAEIQRKYHGDEQPATDPATPHPAIDLNDG